MVEILNDQEREAENLCNQGIDLADQNQLPEAHQIFLKAFELHPEGPKVLSWLGYTTALVERKVPRALEYCRKAVDSHIPDAMFYRNMGVVYLQQNNKRGAIGAFAKGLQIDKGSRDILREWNILGFRRKPLLRFLDRSHAINVLLGKLTYKMKNRNKG